MATTTDIKFNVVAGSTPFVKSKESSGKIFKECTKKEKEFYENLSDDNSLSKLIPKFFGTAMKDGKEYIILEDLTNGYNKPNIMDIKLGLSHHDVDLEEIYSKPNDSDDPNVNFETLKQQANMSLHKELYQSWLVSKYITTPKLGFCVCGSQRYNLSSNQVEKNQKEQGRLLTEVTVKEKLYEFFSNGYEFRNDIIEPMIERLSLFKQYFENNPDYRFRSTSILFIYEGDNNSKNRCDIRLIDFTHTKLYPPHLKAHSSKLSHYKSIDINNIDDNSDATFFPIDGGYLFGITNLLKILLSLKNKLSHQQQSTQSTQNQTQPQQ
ncbi:hypothetical protein DICPUDRAFT_94541 [Dictyostelium purpureum]|uniref:Kinase n=1 Tax=Dictyostelium purpureum TaxID=5786 RepID=F0ZKP0_DICPU|nr:uncharacterized protein DICPUDRAFT_94541 [Dictyostelium purpureum]EGC35496.1 hypothetical protein DICPUDRAFT_94541 [Dictyostelium purpureum]|eukprot:XP_003287975.1 hypothetical protein DICPUDRAFT_94541 [Dictyostelium purpureum]